MRVPGRVRMAVSVSCACGERSPFVAQLPVRRQTFRLDPRPIQTLPNPVLALALVPLLPRVVFEYFRVGDDLVQKGGVREYRVVHFHELPLVAQFVDHGLIFERERENVFATAVVGG